VPVRVGWWRFTREVHGRGVGAWWVVVVGGWWVVVGGWVVGGWVDGWMGSCGGWMVGGWWVVGGGWVVVFIGACTPTLPCPIPVVKAPNCLLLKVNGVLVAGMDRDQMNRLVRDSPLARH